MAELRCKQFCYQELVLAQQVICYRMALSVVTKQANSGRMTHLFDSLAICFLQVLPELLEVRPHHFPVTPEFVDACVHRREKAPV